MIKTEDRLPVPEPIGQSCAKYYVVKVGCFPPMMAMYLVDEDGVCNWYTCYCTMIIRPVLAWMDITEE